MSEVDETMKRLQSHKGVTGLIVIDKEGNFECLGIQKYQFYKYKIIINKISDFFCKFRNSKSKI